MRVLFAVREDLEVHGGGDTMQVLRTAAALRRLGVDVEISSAIDSTWRNFDLVHLWHLERVHETYPRLIHAKRLEKRIVLSPVFWPRYAHGAKIHPVRSWIEDAKNLFRTFRETNVAARRNIRATMRKTWIECRREILQSADVMLTNTQAESDAIEAETQGRVRCRFVPNGVDLDQCLARPRPANRQGILCVGHFDPRKNQLCLVKALRGLGVPITFVGTCRPMHRWYLASCKWNAGPQMRFVGVKSHDEVLDLMASSEVHVCPSHFETPGLVNLEAAVMGCRLVAGDCEPVREYLGNRAVYFRSKDVGALRRAVETALNTACSDARRHVFDNFTWPVAARRTLEAYHEVLAN